MFSRCRYNFVQHLKLFAYGNLMVSTVKTSKDQTKLADLRIDYGSNEFHVEKMAIKGPFYNFQEWFNTTRQDKNIVEPNAMAISTSTKDGKPSIRMVLLKGAEDDKFKFFTNYESRKGCELELNPYASILFYWPTTNRQIRIEGTIEKLSEKESEEYFHTRPRGSQLSALVSHQSNPISSKDELEKKMNELEKKYQNEEIPKPKSWGGYELTANSYEFWQGQHNRFHDRIVFRKTSPKEKINESITKPSLPPWVYERLSP